LRIGLIAPALDLNAVGKGERLFMLPPLTFPVLAALTPPDISVEIVEERVRPVPFDAGYDLVGITFVTAFAPRAYQIADEYRRRGVTVVLGGPHASVLPEEAGTHADAVVVGEAEDLWAGLLEDFRQGRLRKVYKAPGLADLSKFPKPRMDLIPKEFMFRNATLASKGCPFHCDFCFVNMINQYHQRFRPIPDVVRDIEAMGGTAFERKHFIFWDDNFVGNVPYAKRLCRELAPLGKKWAVAASVTVAQDDELLDLMQKAGCIALFIGMESINSGSLPGAGKRQNTVAKYQEMIGKLHDHGIALTGAFVFGFDEDDATVFDRTLDFVNKAALDCMTTAIMTPLPGTPSGDRMRRDGRVFDRDWGHYDYFHVVYRPRLMTPEELYRGFLGFNRDFFSFGSALQRLGHSRTQLLLTILANLGYHKFHSRMFREYEQGLRGVALPAQAG